MIREGPIFEKARLKGLKWTLLLPVPTPARNPAHRRPVKFHTLLQIIDYYACHHLSPVSARGTRNA